MIVLMRLLYVPACLMILLALADAQPLTQQTLTVPDDYPTIQAAIDAADEGDAVAVRPGTYAEHLFIDKPITLRGTTAWETVLIVVDTSEPLITVEGSSELIVEIKDLMLARTQVPIADPGRGVGVLARGEARVRVSDSAVINQAGSGILAEERARLQVENTTLTANGYGIIAHDDAIAVVESCYISSSRWSGVAVSGHGQVLIRNSIMEANSEGGAHAMHCSAITIESSVITENGYGVALHHSAQAFIQGNRIQNNRTSALAVTDRTPQLPQSPPSCEGQLHARVIGNSLDGNGETGLRIFGYEDANIMVLLEDNTISGNGWKPMAWGDELEELKYFSRPGVSIGGRAAVEIRGNSIQDNAGAGVGGGPESVISGCGNVIAQNGIPLHGSAPPSLLMACVGETEEDDPHEN